MDEVLDRLFAIDAPPEIAPPQPEAADSEEQLPVRPLMQNTPELSKEDFKAQWVARMTDSLSAASLAATAPAAVEPPVIRRLHEPVQVPTGVLLTPAQLEHHTQDFNGFDTDGDGALNDGEIAQLVVRQLGFEPAEEMKRAIVEEINHNQDGVVMLDEYLDWVCGRGWAVDTTSVFAQNRPGTSCMQIDTGAATAQLDIPVTLPSSQQELHAWFEDCVVPAWDRIQARICKCGQQEYAALLNSSFRWANPHYKAAEVDELARARSFDSFLPHLLGRDVDAEAPKEAAEEPSELAVWQAACIAAGASEASPRQLLKMVRRGPFYYTLTNAWLEVGERLMTHQSTIDQLLDSSDHSLIAASCTATAALTAAILEMMIWARHAQPVVVHVVQQQRTMASPYRLEPVSAPSTPAASIEQIYEWLEQGVMPVLDIVSTRLSENANQNHRDLVQMAARMDNSDQIAKQSPVERVWLAACIGAGTSGTRAELIRLLDQGPFYTEMVGTWHLVGQRLLANSRVVREMLLGLEPDMVAEEGTDIAAMSATMMALMLWTEQAQPVYELYATACICQENQRLCAQYGQATTTERIELRQQRSNA